MKLLIMAANGRIARLVESRVLSENDFSDVELTLFVRNANQVSDRGDNSRVTVIEGSLDNSADVTKAVSGQDMVFVAAVDHTPTNTWTKNVIAAMQAANVKRVVFANILGIYNEVPGEFGRWNQEMVASGLASAQNSDKLLSDSGLDYTTLRIPWLNDHKEVAYTVTHKGEPYVGVSGSRRSAADVVLKIVADPTFGSRDSLGFADPATKDEIRPVY
ncbi:NAD(P)H-binding protein [Secundilactobacillus kimchicus]|uniref:NAD(P)H-binding protein n=1 Tax=Secundilactobacillus kimchicus TaxID=528209 RepID=UPI001C015958|nr:NAD(P)H-binding protein [Secundilactobacillus kimchicus]MBT9671561.1 NAD(P)H-binding protein [Secundilactobacillus kimchicus]